MALSFLASLIKVGSKQVTSKPLKARNSFREVIKQMSHLRPSSGEGNFVHIKHPYDPRWLTSTHLTLCDYKYPSIRELIKFDLINIPSQTKSCWC